MKISSPCNCPFRRLTSPINIPAEFRICIFPVKGNFESVYFTVSIPLISSVKNSFSASVTVPVQILESDFFTELDEGFCSISLSLIWFDSPSVLEISISSERDFSLSESFCSNSGITGIVVLVSL